MFSTARFLLICMYVVTIRAAPVALERSTQSCAPNGSFICGPNGTSFSICDRGTPVFMGGVAAGTICKDGNIVVIERPSNQSFVPPLPEPIQIEDPEFTTTTKVDVPSATNIMNNGPVAGGTPTTTITITTIQQTRVQRTSIITVTAGGGPTGATTAAAVSSGAPSTNGIQITPDLLLKVAPSSDSCAGAPAGECGTAQEAAPFITEAFAKYNINTIGEVAAILSLMAFESGDFRFNTNQFPGRPGQGTKAMLMPNFIVAYAQTFGSTDDIQAGLTSENIDNAPDSVKDAVLSRVLSNDRTYASAAWFYSEYCSDTVKAGLRAGPTTEAWTTYITACVFTTATDDRKAGFDKAVAALTSSS